MIVGALRRVVAIFEGGLGHPYCFLVGEGTGEGLSDWGFHGFGLGGGVSMCWKRLESRRVGKDPFGLSTIEPPMSS